MDVATAILEDLKVKGKDLINQWVADGYREDLHLDFKRKTDPKKPQLHEIDRRNFSKALSGFSNSDGGLIIWGIGAPGSGSNRRSKHPIKSVRSFAEFLDSFLSRFVSPAVPGAQNVVVYENEKRNIGYVASYVPKSDSAPHRAEADGLKHYYKRYGDSFKSVEHYELEYMFGRRLKPDLRVFWGVELFHSVESTSNKEEILDCFINVGLTNQGRAIARYACLRMRFDQTGPYNHEKEHLSELIHYSQPQKASKTNYVIVTARAMPALVIYPGDHQHFFTFSFPAKRSDIEFGNAPKLQFSYDLFAENFHGQTGERFAIAGKKICQALRKKIDTKE